MESSSFFERNKAYFYTVLGLFLIGFVFVEFLMIMDWGYLFRYKLHILSGGSLDGVLTPATSTYQQMVNTAFGPSYNTIAPEIIRASNERQLYIWWVFVAEIAIFCYAYAVYGRKSAVITRPDDQVEVFSIFQHVFLNL